MPAGGVVHCVCGREWNTARLPEADLRGLDRLLARSRRNRMVFLATMVLVVGALLLVGRNAPLPLAALIFALAWWRFCRPWWRQRRQAAQLVRELPTWQLIGSGDFAQEQHHGDAT